MDDLLFFLEVKFRVVHESKKGAKFWVDVMGRITDEGGSLHPFDNFFQPFHSLAGVGGKHDEIDPVPLIVALAGNTVGG